jgi:hypothetical protein
MARFFWNRRWTFILALGVSLVFCSAAFHPGTALASTPSSMNIGDPGGGADQLGDPDLPSGPTKNTRAGTTWVRGGVTLETSTAGDSRVSSSVGRWWRLRVALLSLRNWLVRF